MIKGIILETFKTTNIPDLNRNKTRSIPLKIYHLLLEFYRFRSSQELILLQ